MPESTLDIVIRDTLSRIKPSREERELLLDTFSRIKDAIISCSSSFNMRRVVEGGSVAKDTFLSGDTDLDIFVQIETNTKKTLEKFTYLTAECISKKIGNCKYQIAYAENPYTRLFIQENGKIIEADIVPIAFASNYEELKKALKISGMARTPFHTEYAQKNLTESMKDEVRLLKYFMKQKRIYGIFGFTGWLCELLIIYYKKFLNVLHNAKNVVNLKIDLLGRFSEDEIRAKFPHDKIIIIDPTDPDRNAAAGIQGFVGEIYLKRFIKSTELGLKEPKKLFEPIRPTGNIMVKFKIKSVEKALKENIITSIGRVANNLYRNLIKWEYVIEDLYILHDPPQLYLKVNPFSKEYDLLVGPPIKLKQAVERFKEKHKEHEIIIKDNRYYAKVPPRFPTAIDAVKYTLSMIKLKLFSDYSILDLSKNY